MGTNGDSTDTDSNELVSVVLPTYYRNERLREAIESVHDQTYRPIEIIVVDGSGEAHARPIAEEFPDAIYVAQADDEGPQAARSLGIERVSGRYVQLLDDDDRLAPTKFEKQVPLLEPPVGVVYSGMIDEERGEIEPNPDLRGDVLRAALEMRTFPCITSTMLIDREVLDGMMPLGHRHGADDTGTKVELARRTRFDFVDEPLVFRGKTDTALSDSWAYVEGRKTVVETYDHLYAQFPPSVRRRAVRETHYQAARKLLEEQWWSPRAVLESARAAYYTPDRRGYYLGALLGSAFGRPGIRAVSTILS
jgi:glycosyltransferase involved in cell wall biosynthesis